MLSCLQWRDAATMLPSHVHQGAGELASIEPSVLGYLKDLAVTDTDSCKMCFGCMLTMHAHEVQHSHVRLAAFRY